MTNLDLNSIKARLGSVIHRWRFTEGAMTKLILQDLPALIAEVEHLRETQSDRVCKIKSQQASSDRQSEVRRQL